MKNGVPSFPRDKIPVSRSNRLTIPYSTVGKYACLNPDDFLYCDVVGHTAYCYCYPKKDIQR